MSDIRGLILQLQTSDFRLAISMFVVLAIATVYFRIGGFENYGFAEEIGNVAASVADGQGFANTFDTASGATAWCPPAYIGFYALIFKLFGVKSVYSYWALFISRAAILTLTFYLLLKLDYSPNIDRYRVLLFPIFAAYALFVVVSRKADDVFLQIFFASLILYAFSEPEKIAGKAQRLLLLLIAIVIPFTSLSYFLATMLLLLWTFVRISNRNYARYRYFLILLGSISIIGSLGWGLRNYYTLDRFIPFKSNLWFEFYLANVVDDDGISKWSNFRLYHPLGNPEVLEQYKSLGEAKFMDEYKAQSTGYLKTEYIDFVKKIGNRIFEAYIFTTSQIDIEPAGIEQYNTADLVQLEQHNLVRSGYWVCLEMPDGEFEKLIRSMDIEQTEEIVQDWKAKSKIVKDRIRHKGYLKNYLRTVLICFIPLMAILFGLGIKHIRQNKVFLISLFLYAISMGPYILISFLPRYQFFQMTFFVVFVFYSLAYIADRLLPEDQWFSA